LLGNKPLKGRPVHGWLISGLSGSKHGDGGRNWSSAFTDP
jgi:hypothetical protein